MRARTVGDLTNHSPPIFSFFFKAEVSSWAQFFTLCAKISPQWLSKLRKLWTSIPIVITIRYDAKCNEIKIDRRCDFKDKAK